MPNMAVLQNRRFHGFESIFSNSVSMGHVYGNNATDLIKRNINSLRLELRTNTPNYFETFLLELIKETKSMT